jgi:hypothetical protein
MSTSPKQTPPPAPRVTLKEDDGLLIAVYPWKLYRFLLSDGRTLDVKAVRDDSDLRGEVVKLTKGRIEGVACIGEVDLPEAESIPPAKVESRKRVVKKVAAKA